MHMPYSVRERKPDWKLLVFIQVGLGKAEEAAKCRGGIVEDLLLCVSGETAMPPILRALGNPGDNSCESQHGQ
jgi:hypothetical protein